MPGKADSLLAIVSHDAGGAEVLSSYVRRFEPRCLFVLDGPARGIFERKLGPVATTSLLEALHHADRVLCGTSWQSDLELEAIKMSRSLGKPCVVFLDHWVNYRERFDRAGMTCLPDEVWVGDEFAERIASQVFSGLPVRFVENPYFLDIRDALHAIACDRVCHRDRGSVLYVCEPISEHALARFGSKRYWGYTEEDALRYFLANLAALGMAVERITIRPHPSEPADKYRWAQRESDRPIAFGGSRPLIEEVVESDAVAGCESMAMVVGLLAGKRVISCIPPGGRACVLPQAQIQHLAQLLRQ